MNKIIKFVKIEDFLLLKIDLNLLKIRLKQKRFK